MKLFERIADGMDLRPALAQVEDHPELWNRDPERLSQRGPHWQTRDIWLRYKDKAENVASGDWRNFSDEHIPIWYPAAAVLTEARELALDLMARVRGEMLGAVLVYDVPPGAEILPHTDMGWHPRYFAKFNFALQSQDGCAFFYPDHDQEMRAITGDLHWFRNTVPHGVRNTSDRSQLILTACIRTPLFKES